MENLRKKNQTEILEIKSPFSQTKNTVKSSSNRLEQLGDRILELEVKQMLKKKKIEEFLVKQLKTCERNVQEFRDSIKRSNLRIMGIEEREEV
jgi:dsRNA-specific ribonuclease